MEQTSLHLDKLSHYFQGLDDQHGTDSPTLLKPHGYYEPIRYFEIIGLNLSR